MFKWHLNNSQTVHSPGKNRRRGHAAFRAWTVIAVLLVVLPLFGGCASGQGFESRFNSIIVPYRFNTLGWELSALPGQVRSYLLPGGSADRDSLVLEFFSLNDSIPSLQGRISQASARGNSSTLSSLQSELDNLERRKAATSQQVEQVLRQQVSQAYAREGIYNPLVPLHVFFPPVAFKLESPPHLLVVSPRTKIEPMIEVPVKQKLSAEEMESIESKVDELGVSSLVVELGGIGATYPAFVADEYDLQFTLNIIAEEWLHQYLAFTPLGFLYVLDLLGIRPDYQVATMNETLAGMGSDEIGAVVYQEHYAQKQAGRGDTGSQPPQSSGFDFNREMRTIRQTVDSYLAAGEVDRAEQYMEQKRVELMTHGYYIRKLNQGYFAFHGTYGSSPASVSPVRGELDTLRTRSGSLKDFLDSISGMTSYQELHDTAR